MARNIYGFERKKSTLAITVIEVIVIAFLAISIIAMLIFFFMFSKEGSHPKIFGYNVYLVNGVTMEPEIPKDTAVFSKPDEVSSLVSGDVVLCYVEYNDEKITSILRILDIQLEDGETFYILKADSNPDNLTVKLPKENLIAKCVSMSIPFGKILAFSTSTLGILTGIIVPCVLFIVVQILRIMRLKRLDEDDDEDEDYYTDDVLFSTLNKDEEYEDDDIPDAPPVKKLYVGDEGKAEYHKKALPNSGYDELHQTIRNTSNNQNRSSSQYGTVSANFRQKPTARDDEISYKRPVKNYNDFLQDNTYDRPKLYYDKSSQNNDYRLDPPAIKNPVGITIPADAVKPKETIAPPPKKPSNKTVEELMKVIDQAQSGLKK